MNEFENKLRCREFLPPPAEVREAVLAAGERAKAREATTCREWLWPSPLAWGAVAAVLLAAIILNSQLSVARAPAAVIAVAYSVEKWRGQRAWEAYAGAAKQRGVKLWPEEFDEVEIPDVEN